MLSNYYKTALRGLRRNPFYATLNIAGLALGIAFTLLIGIFCWSELCVNQQLTHPDRQYILTSDWKDSNMGYPLATLGPLPKALKDQYPTLIKNFYRFDGVWPVVSAGNNHFREGLQIGDSTLLPMYGFSLLQGDAATALQEPGNVVITKEKAIKFFGTTDAVSRTLTIDNFGGGRRDFRVTGVMQDPPRNSVTRLSASNENGIFISTANLAWFGRNMEWSNPHIAGYIELQPGVSITALEAPIRELLHTHTPKAIGQSPRHTPGAKRILPDMRRRSRTETDHHPRIHCGVYPRNGADQFHQPVHQPGIPSTKRDRYPQSIGRSARPTENTVPAGIPNTNPHRNRAGDSRLPLAQTIGG